MVMADVLILSGSGFSHLAALVGFHRLVYFFPGMRVADQLLPPTLHSVPDHILPLRCVDIRNGKVTVSKSWNASKPLRIKNLCY